MRCAVSGGSGFIGSHLCGRLLDDGHAVVCLDNLSTGDACNVSHLRERADFTFIQTDVTEPLPDVGSVDAVFHLASPASPPGYLRRPVETMLANSAGTHRLLDLARANGARFLLASTSEA